MTDFETVYTAYPRKQGRFEAEIWWMKTKPDKELVGKMLVAIKKRRAEKAFLRARNRFASPWPHFDTWCHQHRWEDGFDEAFEASLKRVFRPKRKMAVKLGEVCVATLEERREIARKAGLHKLREQKE